MTLTVIDTNTVLDAQVNRCPSCGGWRWQDHCTLCNGGTR